MHNDGVPSDPQMNTCLVRDGPQPIALVVDAAGGRISMVSALQRRGRGQHARSAAVCRAAYIGRPVVPATQAAAFGSP